MIKNVIFDCGQVLVHFEPEYMVRQYVSNESDVPLLTEVVFDRLYWNRLDEGTISNEEVLSACHERLPKRLWEIADEIYYGWIYNIPEIEGMSELIKYIKEEYGVKTYLLSNISEYFSSHAHKVPILSLLDGCVFSSAIKEVKPNPPIYRHLLEKFALEASECVFVDDRKENIDTAVSLGIGGYVFDGNVDKLREFFDNILKK